MPLALPLLIVVAATLAYRGQRRSPPRVTTAQLSVDRMQRLSAGLQALVRQSRVVRASLEGAVAVIDTPDPEAFGYRKGGDETETTGYRSHLVAADANVLLADLAKQAAALPIADRDVLTRAGFSVQRFTSLLDLKPEGNPFSKYARVSREPVARALQHLDALEPALASLGPGDPYRG